MLTRAIGLRKLSGHVPPALQNPFVARTGMIRIIAHLANPAPTLLATPLKIDGARPTSSVCPAGGPDHDTAPPRARQLAQAGA